MSVSVSIAQKLMRRRLASEPMFDIALVAALREGAPAADPALRAQAEQAMAVLKAGGTVALTNNGKLFARLGPLFES